MTLAFFLKILTDLCFYTCFSAFFAGLYGLEGSLLPQLGLMALAAALSRVLWEKRPGWPRFLPLALLAPCFLWPLPTAGLVILIPPAVYVCWTVWASRFHLGYYAAVDAFLLECKLLPLPALFALVLGQAAIVERFSIPYFLVFALGSILLLRMLRQDEETLRQPRFRLMNLASLAGLCLLGLIVGSPWFRQGVLWVFKSIWSVVSFPIFLVVGGVATLLALGMNALFTLLMRNKDPQVLEEMVDYLEQGEEQSKELLEEALQEPDPTRQLIFAILLLLLAAVVTFFIFRALRARRQDQPSAAGTQTRYQADARPPAERPLTRLNARTPAQQVRYWYQQFLKATRQEGGGLTAAMDTRQQTGVAEEVFSGQQEALSQLRQVYLPARYRDTATPQDAQTAKELYRQIKK